MPLPDCLMMLAVANIYTFSWARLMAICVYKVLTNEEAFYLNDGLDEAAIAENTPQQPPDKTIKIWLLLDSRELAYNQFQQRT